jgi:hypothetical protein
VKERSAISFSQSCFLPGYFFKGIVLVLSVRKDILQKL